MAAFDAEIVDPFREIKHIVTFEPQIVKCIHPFTASIEMANFAFEPSFADLNIPWTHARTLEAWTEGHAVLIEAFASSVIMVLRQLSLVMAPQSSPWPTLVSRFLTVVFRGAIVFAQRMPASISRSLS